MIKVLLFAHLQEAVGRDELNLKTEEISVRDLKEEMRTKYQLSLDNVMTAINEEYALEDDLVHTGDTIAFIPPVSGG